MLKFCHSQGHPWLTALEAQPGGDYRGSREAGVPKGAGQLITGNDLDTEAHPTWHDGFTKWALESGIWV